MVWRQDDVLHRRFYWLEIPEGVDVDAGEIVRAKVEGQVITLETSSLRDLTLRLSDKLVGPLVYGFSSDPVAAAKVISAFAKDNDKLVVKAGAMANFVMDEAGVKALATMPSREELLAKLMATMQAPIGKFVRTLNEVPTLNKVDHAA